MNIDDFISQWIDDNYNRLPNFFYVSNHTDTENQDNCFKHTNIEVCKKCIIDKIKQKHNEDFKLLNAISTPENLEKAKTNFKKKYEMFLTDESC